MRTVFSIAALLLTLSAGAAAAQQTPDTTPPASSTNSMAPKADTPPPPPPPGPQAGPDNDQFHGDWHRGPMGHRPPPPPPSKAAHFRIETGDIKIDIKCAEDEPTKACADEVNQILDRLQGSSSRDRDRYDDDR